MKLRQTLAVGFLVAGTAAQEPNSSDGKPCQDVHIFLARGNNEPYPGRQGKLVEAICSGIDSCDYEDIEFHNPLPAPYCESVTEGATNGTSQIKAYNKRCPDAKLVVSGYSQGGQVVGDVLGGGGGVLFEGCVQEGNAGLDADEPPGNKIAAALIFGDVRHTADQPFNAESGSSSSGIFPRPKDQLASLDKYGDALRDYCVSTDPICAGGDVVDTHLNYFDVFTDNVASWVQEMVQGDEPLSTTSSAVSTSTKPPASSSEVSTKTSHSSSSATTRESEATDSGSAAATSDRTDAAAEPSASTGEDAAPSIRVMGSSVLISLAALVVNFL